MRASVGTATRVAVPEQATAFARAQPPPSLAQPATVRSRPFAPAHTARDAHNLLATRVLTKWAEEASVSSVGIDQASGISVISHFDSGNCDVVDLSDPQNIRLRIHPDPYCEMEGKEHFQWFYYRIAGVKGKALKMTLVNAGAASYPAGWEGYQARASYDRKRWFLVPTTYDAATGELAISHKPERDACYYAYFAPYTYEMHQSLIASMQSDDRVTLKVLGQTHDGHDIELLRIGEPGPGKRSVWMTARQHPGESMGEWFMEGFMQRLLDRDETLSRKVLMEAVFYLIPNINPDGSWRGHLRTNAEGHNLNRHWDNAVEEEVPEVFHVLRKMDEVGVDMFIDVHGDEVAANNFLIGNEAIPSWNDRLAGLQARFQDSFQRTDPTFCTTLETTADAPGAANLAVAARQVGERFQCLSFTLEMPFKDTAAFPDEEHGWSAVRSQHLGAAMLNAIADVLPVLRD